MSFINDRIQHIANNKKYVYRSWPFMMKFISWLLILAMINLTSCMNFFKVTKSPLSVSQSITELKAQNKIFVLHMENEAWIIHSPEIIDNEIICYTSGAYESVLKKPVKADKPNRFKKNSFESIVLNEVHIYASEMSKNENVRISIPVSAVQRVEIYEKDKGATTGSYILGSLGIAALAFGVFMLILFLTSCPFIYDMNGENPILLGEIYSGSIQPSLERHDYMKISTSYKNQEYKLKIANEAKEIQHTNLMELWVFDKEENTDVLIDKNGTCHTLSDIMQPISAVNLNGENVLKLLNEKDNLFYSTNEITGELPLTDGVILEFPNPKKSEHAKLAIHAKNSFVLDYMLGQFQDQFGDLHSKWQKKQKKSTKEQLMKWSLDQNIPLTLSIERNGKWESLDYFNIAGPIAFKNDILSFPLNGTESNPLKVKLEAGNFMWEIDYAGIDYSIDKDVKYEIIPVKTAVTQKGKDVGKMLQKDDNKYYDQPNIGDEALVTFQIPNTTENEKILILHSKGWYQILRNPSGPADRDYLETFRQPGRFNQFINENMHALTAKKPQ